MSSLGKPVRAGVLLLLIVAVVGCDSGPKVVKVNGTLTHKGKAVPNAVLTFLPEKGRQSWAETDEEGKFKINYDRHQDGAVVGKHKVWVELKNADAVMMGGAAPPSKEMRAFFDKYSQKNSKMEVEITPQTRDLKLEWD